MKNLYEESAATEVKGRISQLRPDSARAWGSMTVAQMLAHKSAWMEMIAGLQNPPRSFAGRIFGKIAKKSVLGNAPIRPNMPTEKSMKVQDDRDFDTEQRRLLEWIDRFKAGGPEACTKHPHCFFGPMTPEEWAVLAYKHLDHHLRQFGA